MRRLFLLSILSLPLLTSASTPPPIPPERLPPSHLEVVPAPYESFAPRAALPALARSLLAQRMENHSHQMTDLLWSVVFLEHDAVVETASEIIDEPGIARPIRGAGADDLSSQLPTRFFDLQDELKGRARDLEMAGLDGNDRTIAVAWGRLSESCVDCHSVYLNQGGE